jgi:hypothetical protein
MKPDLEIAPGAHPGNLLNPELTPTEARAEFQKRLADSARRNPRLFDQPGPESDE